MSELVILVVEDEREVRAAIVRDLASFAEAIRVDQAEDTKDALAALEEAELAGDHVGLILADHRLPGRSGVDLLVSLHKEPATHGIRKVLITGQAGHQDTIRAINDAGLDRYIAKPWDNEELSSVVTQLLTDYVIEVGLDPLAYLQVLDGPRLLEAFSRAGQHD